MILIADCGSTKIDWCILNGTKVEKQIFTMGMNAVMLTEEEMRERLAAELMPELDTYASKIDSVYFYGAGCISTEVCSNVARAIKANIEGAEKIRYTPTCWLQPARCAAMSPELPASWAQDRTRAYTMAPGWHRMCRRWDLYSAMKAVAPCLENSFWVMCSKISFRPMLPRNSSRSIRSTCSPSYGEYTASHRPTGSWPQ